MMVLLQRSPQLCGLLLHRFGIILALVLCAELAAVLPTTMAANRTSPATKLLFVFDFDNTIVDADTYTEVSKLYPGEIPNNVKELLTTQGWPEYMNEVLKLLHASNLTVEDIQNKLRQTKLIPGHKELFAFLQSSPGRYELMILSDANTLFVQTVLEANNLGKTFKNILTNPIVVKPGAPLELNYFHNNTACTKCPKNMCKGQVLNSWKKKAGVLYSRIFYFGDGIADFCPIKTALAQNDFGFGRRDFALGDMLNREKENLKCKTFVWKDGFEIIEELKRLEKIGL